jgi:phosphoribosylaminoimidazolecarboxamide formyltransferase/IMP cyclohydrolase
MSTRKIRRALISVYNKTGIVDFARALVEEFGIEIISTGGTAKLLKERGIPVTLVEEVTGFPEMMDGRVKTLHPKIHAAILADRDNPEHMRQLKEQGIEPIDMVVVNLYPFEETIAKPDCTFEQAIEMIDIGGPCLLRAAAKNHKHVTVVASRGALDVVLEGLRKDWPIVDITQRANAEEAFRITSNYDNAILRYFLRYLSEQTQEYFAPEDPNELPQLIGQGLHRFHTARYGENPHQKAAIYVPVCCGCAAEAAVPRGEVLSEQAPSFNNCFDANAALELCKEVTRELCSDTADSCCAFVKHTNPCGLGTARDPIEAYCRAYLGDPNAAMGGILVCNFQVEKDFAARVMDTYRTYGQAAGAGAFFVEVWVAPTFTNAAVEVIRTRKKWGGNVRLLRVGAMGVSPDAGEYEFKTITGGMLVQTRNLIGLNEDQWKVVTDRKPTDSEMADLRLAWLICKHTKSNAITVCKDNMLIGNGAGQMSRVMSCRIATWLAKENGHGDKLKGAVAASDAFFPFRDGPDILMDAGVTAIIQPGGSKRDQDTIDACNERGVAMIFTGTRHFKH